jgi:hypothetical protein
MKPTRRKILLVIWALAIILASLATGAASGGALYGWAAGFALAAISLGVPLMRAFTEFSE